MKRLQRYEMVDEGLYWNSHRVLRPVEPYTGQKFDYDDEWCNAEEVYKLEDEVTRLTRINSDLVRDYNAMNLNIAKQEDELEALKEENRILKKDMGRMRRNNL